jgi:hypothetical protein
MRKAALSVFIFAVLFNGYRAMGQNVQMQCRPLVANDFVGPDEVIVNDKVCHAVRSTSVQTATPQSATQEREPAAPASTTVGAEPQTQPAKSSSAKAIVVLYRPGRFIDAARKATIYVDNRPLCELTNNSSFKFVLPPGPHSLTTLFNSQKAGETALPGSQFNLVAGQAYYFTLTSHWLIFPVPAQQGESEASRTKPLKDSNIILQPMGNEVN